MAAWAALDEVDLQFEARLRIQRLQDVPGFLKVPLRECFRVCLAEGLEQSCHGSPRQRT